MKKSLKDLFFVQDEDENEPAMELPSEDEVNRRLFNNVPQDLTYDPDVDISKLSEDNDESDTDYIQQAYAKYGIKDDTNSIFKVAELIDNLPEEMPTATKQKSIMGILYTIGLDPVSLTTDGENRVDALDKYRDSMYEYLRGTIADDHDAIEKHKVEIENLTKHVEQQEGIITSLKSSTAKEIEKIESLIKFLNINETDGNNQ